MAAAERVYRPDLFDAALTASEGAAADGIGAFGGPSFDADDIEVYLKTVNRIA
jgi:hypothetical protein